MLPFESILDELVKLGAISTEQARRSLDRLDTLEQQKPTMGQIARNTAVGAGAGLSIGALKNVIAPPSSPVTWRGHLANAAAGALASGAVPLLQRDLDRRAEEGTLKKFIAERGG